MKDKKIYWAIYLILAALVILLNSFDVFPAKLNIFNLIISILMGGIIVGSLINLSFYGVFIPLSVIGILFAEELKITAITPIPIIVIAILLSIGMQIIFKKKI